MAILEDNLKDENNLQNEHHIKYKVFCDVLARRSSDYCPLWAIFYKLSLAQLILSLFLIIHLTKMVQLICVLKLLICMLHRQIRILLLASGSAVGC